MKPATERERMLAGEPYHAWDSELVEARARARRLLVRYNATLQEEVVERRSLLDELLGHAGKDAWIEPPFHCDYGANISLGDGAYLNFRCLVLDCAAVEIGELTKLGPGVQLCTATHPVDPADRAALIEYAKPILLGRNVWIGAGAIICPGVTVGDNSVVGAGSVVVRDVPANVVVAGNPCRLLREL
jgi:maltose O-acetyltransferase